MCTYEWVVLGGRGARVAPRRPGRMEAPHLWRLGGPSPSWGLDWTSLALSHHCTSKGRRSEPRFANYWTPSHRPSFAFPFISHDFDEIYLVNRRHRGEIFLARLRLDGG